MTTLAHPHHTFLPLKKKTKKATHFIWTKLDHSSSNKKFIFPSNGKGEEESREKEMLKWERSHLRPPLPALPLPLLVVIPIANGMQPGF